MANFSEATVSSRMISRSATEVSMSCPLRKIQSVEWKRNSTSGQAMHMRSPKPMRLWNSLAPLGIILRNYKGTSIGESSLASSNIISSACALLDCDLPYRDERTRLYSTVLPLRFEVPKPAILAFGAPSSGGWHEADRGHGCSAGDVDCRGWS
jgi:hypothetical protein